MTDEIEPNAYDHPPTKDADLSRRAILQSTVAGLLGTLPMAARRGAATTSTAGTSSTGGSTIEFSIREGHLRVERSPFRFAIVDQEGTETVASVPGRRGPPLRAPGVDGPQPIEPAGGANGSPALGFVVGVGHGVEFPVNPFTGNRLAGGTAGTLVSVTGVEDVMRTHYGLRLALRTDAPGVEPAMLNVWRLPEGGVTLDLTPPPSLPVESTVFALHSPPDEGLYGLGARKDRFDQRGQLRNVWVEEQNASSKEGERIGRTDPTGITGPNYTFPNGAQAAYYVEASLFGSQGWAAWVSQTTLSRLDLAKSREDTIRWGVAGPRLTLSLAGGGLERASRSYTAVGGGSGRQAEGSTSENTDRIDGRPPAPPRYVYMPWIDVINEGEGEAAPNGGGFSGGARVKRDLETIVAKVAEHDLPVGTLGVEGWHAVPEKETFFPWLREQGFHLSAYWSPFHAPGHPATERARELGILVKDPAGEPYPIVTNRGNRSYVIDFSHPKAAPFWRAQLERSADLGFEAFMHDFGEFVVDGMRFHNGEPPRRMHNAYPVLYHHAARQAVDAIADERRGSFEPFFYVRSGYNGRGGYPGVSAATSSVFPGDETTDWNEGSGIPSVPPAMLNLALTGSFTFTTDVGGYLDLYTPQTTAELFTRWSQMAGFTAVSRIHTSTFHGSKYPWDFENSPINVLDIYRRYARAKVRLVPLVDRWSKRAARKGTVGPVRPLVLDDDSPAARSIDDQWLLGTDILVAPVLEEGARERPVYLPSGSRWQRVVVGDDGRLLDRGSSQAGGQTVTASAPITDIPLFRRVR